MKKSDLSFVLTAVFTSAVGFFYCGASWWNINLPRYYPLEHAWKMVKEKGVPSQGWYGVQVFAFVAAATLTLLVYFALKSLGSKNPDKSLSPTAHKLIGLAATGIIVFCMGFILYQEFSKWGVFTEIKNCCSCLP
ncbi:MAG: hypothetical protein JXD22_00180 [Sedimentisphaerales bacterium]|nr:hypothetical protein [Sedimentisphaerales bacterium]